MERKSPSEFFLPLVGFQLRFQSNHEIANHEIRIKIAISYLISVEFPVEFQHAEKSIFIYSRK